MAATRRLRSSEGRKITGDETGGRAGTRQVYGREAVGLEVRECETEAFWREFLRALASRGLVGVSSRSPTPPGPKAAIAWSLAAPPHWTVLFLRDCLGPRAATSTRARRPDPPILP